jgi:hypothetical protein
VHEVENEEENKVESEVGMENLSLNRPHPRRKEGQDTPEREGNCVRRSYQRMNLERKIRVEMEWRQG